MANGKVYVATFSNKLVVYGILGRPWMNTQPLNQNVPKDQSATLSVAVSGQSTLAYQWYQGASGDTQQPVGANSAIFTTPPLTQTVRYWIRASNGLGSVDSSAATLAVTSRVYLPLLHK